MEISLGAAAFWLALAAVLIAGNWLKARGEALRQETLLKLIETTGRLDEEQMRLLCPPPPLPPHWFAPPEPRDGRAALKVLGTIALSIAVGLAMFFTVLLRFGGPEQQERAIVGFACTGLVACVGAGLFVAARFVRPPPSKRGAQEIQ